MRLNKPEHIKKTIFDFKLSDNDYIVVNEKHICVNMTSYSLFNVASFLSVDERDELIQMLSRM